MTRKKPKPPNYKAKETCSACGHPPHRDRCGYRKLKRRQDTVECHCLYEEPA